MTGILVTGSPRPKKWFIDTKYFFIDSFNNRTPLQIIPDTCEKFTPDNEVRNKLGIVFEEYGICGNSDNKDLDYWAFYVSDYNSCAHLKEGNEFCDKIKKFIISHKESSQ